MKKIINPTNSQEFEWRRHVTIKFKNGNMILCNTMDSFEAFDTDEEADSFGLIVVKELEGDFYKKDDLDTVLVNTIEYIIFDDEYK